MLASEWVPHSKPPGLPVARVARVGIVLIIESLWLYTVILSAHTLRWRDPNGRWDACRGASGGAPQLVCAIVMARMRGGTRSG